MNPIPIRAALAPSAVIGLLFAVGGTIVLWTTGTDAPLGGGQGGFALLLFLWATIMILPATFLGYPGVSQGLAAVLPFLISIAFWTGVRMQSAFGEAATVTGLAIGSPFVAFALFTALKRFPVLAGPGDRIQKERFVTLVARTYAACREGRRISATSPFAALASEMSEAGFREALSEEETRVRDALLTVELTGEEVLIRIEPDFILTSHRLVLFSGPYVDERLPLETIRAVHLGTTEGGFSKRLQRTFLSMRLELSNGRVIEREGMRSLPDPEEVERLTRLRAEG